MKAVQPGDWFTDVREVQTFLQALPLPKVFEINERALLEYQ